MRRLLPVVIPMIVVAAVSAALYVSHATAKDWATGLIATGALLLGLFNIWQSHLSAFRLVVRDTGRLEWSKDPRNLAEPLVFVDLVFTNDGIRRGFVELLGLKLGQNKASAGFVVLLPMYTATDRALNLGKELPPPNWEPFTGFELGPKESVVRKIGFVPLKTPSGFTYKEGVYTVDAFVRIASVKGWKKMLSMNYPCEKADLDQLQKIRATPQPDGRLYVLWLTQSKLSDALLKAFSELDKIQDGG